MSLADLAVLLELTTGQADPGSDAVMERYHQIRHRDIQARVAGIHALNRASMLSDPLMRDLRAGALSLAYGLKPLRQALMKAGLGIKSAL